MEPYLACSKKTTGQNEVSHISWPSTLLFPHKYVVSSLAQGSAASMKAVFRVFGEVTCYFGESEEERHHRMVRLLATRFFLCSVPAQKHMPVAMCLSLCACHCVPVT